MYRRAQKDDHSSQTVPTPLQGSPFRSINLPEPVMINEDFTSLLHNVTYEKGREDSRQVQCLPWQKKSRKGHWFKRTPCFTKVSSAGREWGCSTAPGSVHVPQCCVSVTHGLSTGLDSGDAALLKLFQKPFLASSKEREVGWIFFPEMLVAQTPNRVDE